MTSIVVATLGAARTSAKTTLATVFAVEASGVPSSLTGRRGAARLS